MTSYPFSIRTYRDMVQEATSLRTFATYDEAMHLDEFVIWRHDCDMSLNRAKFISNIDYELGVTSTFFISLHSAFYNALEANQSKLIKDIVSDGHRIGLHFDLNYYNCPENEIEFSNLISHEAGILEEIAGSCVDVFSFHNPDDVSKAYRKYKYSDKTNCYSDWMIENIHYSSDSNGYWRYTPIPEVIRDESKKKLQILTHPEWWLTEESPPRDHVLRCAYGRALSTVKEYDKQLAGFTDRENIKEKDSSLSDFVRSLKTLELE
jgi:hypothetical protein